jgi:hypothetical protein
MHAPMFSILALGVTTFQLIAAQETSTQKVGWSGKLSSLDGGLEGTISVLNSNTLMITDYKLEDASAPALYWWGTTNDVLKDGFRISNAQVKEKASTNSLTIMLDAGKTPADFSTVGLWCERLNANFGQATLAATGNKTGTTSTTASSTAATTTATPAMTGGGLVNTVGWAGGVIGVATIVAILLF